MTAGKASLIRLYKTNHI